MFRIEARGRLAFVAATAAAFAAGFAPWAPASADALDDAIGAHV